MKTPRYPVLVLLFIIIASLTIQTGSVIAAQSTDTAEKKNMVLVGTNDLQSRSTYQPVVHQQGTQYILYAGHHSLGTNPVTNQPLPSFNPLTNTNEPNGTSLVDVSDPKHPVYLAHIPVGTTGNGGAQMVRVCDGSTLPVHNNKVYMLRSYTGGNNTSAHEIWDTTDPSHPKPIHTVAGGNPVIGNLIDTHKSWWECDTGIAYLVGNRAADPASGWKPGNHIMIFDLSNPEATDLPFIRDWALDGQQPGGQIPPHFTTVPPIHGPISTGPDNSSNPIAGTGATLNRVYFAYGVGANGVMQIVDRDKLLPPEFGGKTGVACGANCDDYTSAELGRLIMNPDNGAHTSWPIGTITIPDFVTGTGNDDDNTTRDVVVVTSEAGGAFCNQFRHLTFLTDVTDEGRPQSISTFQVPAASDGFCNRGGRFGPHATNEEFGPPFYQKIVLISYFNGGVRAVDVRDPYNPQEVAFYIPSVTPNTDLRCGPFQGNPNACTQVIQTNNVATDNRGFIYIVDRANTGLHILRLTGKAATIIQ
jgi:hypothetical protein